MGNLNCDICGFIDQSVTGSICLVYADGVIRCKLCRQKAKYGKVMTYDEEFERDKAGVDPMLEVSPELHMEVADG